MLSKTSPVLPLLIILCAGFFFGADGAARQSILPDQHVSKPILSVIRTDCSGTELSFANDTIANDTIANTLVDTPRGPFTLLSLEDGGDIASGFTADIGKPRLPVIREFIEIPEGAVFELLLEDARYRETTLAELGAPGPIAPAQPPLRVLPDAIEDSRFEIDEAVYGSDAFVLPELPAGPVRIAEELRLRGRRLLVLEIFPLNYRPLSGTVRILSSGRIVIRCSGADSGRTRDCIERCATQGYDDIARDLILNAAAFEQSLGGGTLTSGRGSCYLMICAPAFTGNVKLQDLITLRTAEGYDVVLVDTSTTGTGSADIKGYIQQAYDTWSPPPEALLLIGDTDTIPCFIGQGADNPATDLYYACVDGSDYVPDIMRGRLPVRTDTHLDNLIAKILANASNTVEKAVFMASNDVWTLSEGAHNYVIDNYMDFAGWTSDKLYCHTYNATTSQVTSALNDGRSIACYQGHGSVFSWADGPPFTKTNVRNLTNTVYPLVLSFACLTGKYTADECFGETWVRDDGGATSFFGASVVSYWNYNNALEKRIFKGCFNHGYGRIGAMIDFGQYEIYLTWGGTQSARLGYYEMYNLLGDPAMDVIENGGVRIPFPDVKVNGQDGTLTVPQGTAVSVTIGLDPGNFSGMTCDWWVWASTPISPYGSFWWRPGQGWKGSYMPVKAFNGALFEFSEFFIGSISTLPAGSYQLIFALDEPNGVYEATYSDTFDLIVN